MGGGALRWPLSTISMLKMSVKEEKICLEHAFELGP